MVGWMIIIGQLSSKTTFGANKKVNLWLLIGKVKGGGEGGSLFTTGIDWFKC